jgi:hypothetical protein
MIVINATIRTEGPLSIVMPVAEGSRENAYSNFPVMTRGIDEDGNKLQTGYLPATTLRGFLRRAIVIKDMGAAAEAGKPYKLPQAYSELIGQDAASEQQAGDIDLLALKTVRENSPVLDLFGSGLGIKSRLRVSHFLPSHNVLPDIMTGTRKDLDDNESAFNLLDEADKNEFFERSVSNTKRARAASLLKGLVRRQQGLKRKGESTQEIDKEVDAAQKLVDKYVEEMGDMKNSSRTIVDHPVLAAGLSLTGRLVIENDKERDIGLIETALNALSLFPVLGGQSARGCGEISGTFEFTRDGNVIKKVTIGGYKPATIDNY